MLGEVFMSVENVFEEELDHVVGEYNSGTLAFDEALSIVNSKVDSHLRQGGKEELAITSAVNILYNQGMINKDVTPEQARTELGFIYQGLNA